MRQGALIEDPSSDGNVPIGVGITEQRTAVEQKQRIDRDREPKPGRNDAGTASLLLLGRGDVCACQEILRGGLFFRIMPQRRNGNASWPTISAGIAASSLP